MPRCKNCKEKFEAKYFNQKFCMDKDDCIKEFNQSVKLIIEKQKKDKWTLEKSEISESLKTKSEYEKELQKEINTIARLIDKNSLCHSTLKPLNEKFQLDI